MSRWPPDAAPRLRAAAIELFLQQGFAATSVPQITAHAGLTTRSFFRYYTDKREVLFAGEEELPGVVARIFTEADLSLEPMEVVRHGIHTVLGPRLEHLRDDLITRKRIIDTDEGLQERQLRKLAILHTAATRAFHERGLPPLDAELAGRIAVAVYDTALNRWLEDHAQNFETVADQVLDALPRITLISHPPPLT